MSTSTYETSAGKSPAGASPAGGPQSNRVEAVISRLARLTGEKTGAGRLRGPYGRSSAGEPLAKFVFEGPTGGGEPIHLGFFAAIHGDEPESALGLVRFVEHLAANPGLAEGYQLHIYPVCNPTGLEDGTRWSRSGKDLNREFWRDSAEAEVRQLEAEFHQHQFHGLVSLHCDDTSDGLYVFLSGHETGNVLSAALLEPALQSAEQFLPRNEQEVIDNFPARKGILHRCYDGVLRSPSGLDQQPFEIVFETPQRAETQLQVEAFNAALLRILREYRQFISYAQDL